MSPYSDLPTWWVHAEYTCECDRLERRLYSVTDHDGMPFLFAYCVDCANLASIDWNGETWEIRPCADPAVTWAGRLQLDRLIKDAAYADREGNGISTKDTVARRFLAALNDAPGLGLPVEAVASALVAGRVDLASQVLGNLQRQGLVTNAHYGVWSIT